MRIIILSLLLQYITALASAQEVPVNKEPRHHPVFENKKIRVLNVLLPGGDTSLYHLHSTPSVFISLSTTKTAAQLKGGQPSPFGLSTQGNIWFENLSPPHTRIHRVWNEDTSTFHVVDVELFTDSSAFAGKPFILSHGSVIIDTAWVRVYKIDLNKNDKFDFPKSNNSFLLIAIHSVDAEISQNNKKVKDARRDGDFVWFNPGDKIAITNKSGDNASFVLLEVK